MRITGINIVVEMVEFMIGEVRRENENYREWSWCEYFLIYCGGIVRLLRLGSIQKAIKNRIQD